MKQRNKGMRTSILFLLAVLTLAGCQAGVPAMEDEEEQSTPVMVAEAVRSDLTQHTEIVGVTNAEKNISVVPKAAGELAVLHVSTGDVVQRGQLLAELDDSDLSLALEMERAALALSRNQLDAARSRHNQAASSAKDALQQSGEMNEQIEENIRQSALAVEQAEMSVEVSELQVQLAEKRLADSKIYAPSDGIIASVEAEVGELVSGQAPLFMIVSDENLIIEAAVSAGQLGMFVPGETREVYFPITDEQRTGTVKPLPASADQTGLYKVELSVSNDDQQIKPGVPARIIVPHVLVEDALLVPTDAIIENGSDSYVFVIRDGLAVRTEVDIIRTQTDLTAVGGELEDGDPVVIRGQLTLTDGGSVTIVEGGR